MKKAITAFLVCSIICIQQIKSQKKFAEGYIVTLNNDTIHGKVKNRNNFSSCKNVIFMNDKGQEKKYKPKQISAYTINNTIYRSYKFKGILLMERSFLKLIEEGEKLSLFIHYTQTTTSSGGGAGHPGAVPTGRATSTQTVETYYLKKNGEAEFTRVKPLMFAKQMSTYFNDNIELSEKILNKEYRQHDIIEIVRIYNED